MPTSRSHTTGVPANGLPSATVPAASGPPGSAAIASGNAATTAAAAAALRAGGNAVDAVVAAGFASAVSEPGLTSVAGGGFLTLRHPDGTTELLDFFTAVPGIGGFDGGPQATTVTVVYPSATQDFRVGAPAAAVPGCLSGYLEVHRRYGVLPLATVIAPAIELAGRGTPMDSSQSYIMGLIEDIMRFTPEAEAIYAPAGEILAEGDILIAPELSAFFADVGRGLVTDLQSERFAAPLLAMASDGCRISAADLASYRPIWRDPLTVRYSGWRLDTNPAPAFGGAIVAAAVAGARDTSTRAITDSLRAATEAAKGGPRATTGTTHISVADASGLVAAMTTTNGTNGGVLVPTTGVHLNNMLGEDDLLPDGIDSVTPGERLRSMSAPTILTDSEGGVVALGSGGSARIRSAMTTVILRLSIDGASLVDAVGGPRAHHEDTGVVQVEPGLRADDLSDLRSHYQVNEWPVTDFYFGGVNAVQRLPDGTVIAAADHRRGGSVEIVAPG